MEKGRADTRDKYPAHPLDYIGDITMPGINGRERYGAMLDALGDAEIMRYDREESGRFDGGRMEHEQGNGALTFAALCRSDQIAILRTIADNLPTRTARVNRDAATSYGLKHAIERMTGFYVSNLQAKTALRILGYVRGGDDLNPHYNISRREWRALDERARDVAARRSAAERRIDRQNELRACARYFYKLGA